jgi:replicative DNA helicase
MSEALALPELPIDLDNEALILSNAMKNKKNLELFVRKTDFLDFRYKESQVIAWSIKEVQKLGMEVNVDAVLLKSKACPVRYNIDLEFLENLVNSSPEVTEINFDNHISKLQLDKIKSELMTTFHKSIYTACLNPRSDLNFLSSRMKNVNDILQKGYSYSQVQFKDMKQIVEDYKEYRKHAQGFYTTGFTQLDAYLTEGLKPKSICIIAGLPGMGKSSYCLSSINNLANLGIYSAQFALEMDNNALTTKLASFRSRLSIEKIVKHYASLSAEEKQLLEYELDRLATNKYMRFNDTPTQTLPAIREQIMVLQDHLKQEYIVVSIDLFGKIKEFQDSDNFASDYEKKLNQVQIMAKETGVCVIPVAQIHRLENTRKFKRPKMNDLKNSGAWEEVADLMLAVHRPWYDPETAMKKQIADNEYKYGIVQELEEIEDDPNESIAEVIILKQRMGEGNRIVNFYFDKVTTRYSPITPEFQETLNAEKDFSEEEVPI